MSGAEKEADKADKAAKRVRIILSAGKGVRNVFSERPGGCFAQKVRDLFFYPRIIRVATMLLAVLVFQPGHTFAQSTTQGSTTKADTAAAPNAPPTEVRERLELPWLQKPQDVSASVPAKELTETGPLNVLAVVRLIREFKQRDATLREAAIRRLLKHPDVAAGPVVAAFMDGSLSTRLTALELLTEWDAPVAGLDPWCPETLSDKRLKSLSDWASTPDAWKVAETEATRKLNPEERATARQMMDRMLAADAVEARGIRERLARFGASLLPDVYARLEAAETDADRESLTVLRYRLLAPDDLVLDWPGGLERLAGSDVADRRRAVQQLASRATAADEPLLLELFSDPAAFVREISLQALQKVGGSGSSSAMVHLLNDPEPNVRAAVLKQLAESPSAGLVPQMRDYLAREKDADLVVHGVRVLREIRGKAATQCLMTLLDHASWRVRAEAAEAIGKTIKSVPDSDQTFQADAYVALVKLLKDADAFVVSRAVTALADADLVVVVDPLARVAADHPELAVEVVKVLSQGEMKKAKAIPHLHKFLQHINPKVRAAAITGLCHFLPNDAQDELRTALRDKASQVRIAAAEAIFDYLESRREKVMDRSEEAIFSVASESEPIKFTQFGSSGGSVTALELGWDAILDKIRAGKFFPKWIFEFVDDVEPLLEAASVRERCGGATVMAALGRDGAAVPVLEEVLQSDSGFVEQIAGTLPWLLWEHRVELYERLVQSASDMDTLSVIARSMAAARDKRALESLWRLLSRPDADARLASIVRDAIRTLYFGARYWSADEMTASVRKIVIDETTPRARGGPKWQRLVALAFLMGVARDVTADIAEQIVDDEKADPEFRADAFQIQLLAQTGAERTQSAIHALSAGDVEIRNRAVLYLAMGTDGLNELGDEGMTLNGYEATAIRSSEGQPIIPQVPRGLTAEPLRPLLQADDPGTVACATYLLALLNQTDDLTHLIDYWQQHAYDDPNWRRLVYRAIAYLDDSSRMPLLQSMYETVTGEPISRYDTSEISEFYWTIRIMTGPEALALRKRIRDEVGMDRLRSSFSRRGLL